MTKEFVFASHPEDDTLEMYCMGRLDEETIAPVEEHLLACVRCQDWVNEHEEFLIAARTAAREVRAEEKYKQEEKARKKESRFGWFLSPAWMTGAVAAAALVIAVPMLRTPSETQTVQLSSFRGESNSGVAEAGHPLQLKLDLRGIPAGSSCCLIEVADSSGKIVARGESEAQGDSADFSAPKLSAGQYWVRIKSKSGEALRESGLLVR